MAAHGNFRQSANSWSISEEWMENPLYAALVMYSSEQTTPIVVSVTKIRLNETGDAWVHDPPYAKIISVAYSVNQGPVQYINLGSALDLGIDVSPGDMLSIEGIWYHAGPGGEEMHTVYVEADAQGPGPAFVQATRRATLPQLLQAEANEIENTSILEWTPLAENCTGVSLVLWRDDGVQLDILWLPIRGSDGARGMTSVENAIIWPRDRVAYVDFEGLPDVTEWRPFTDTHVSLTSSPAFSGRSAIAITLTGGPTDIHQVTPRVLWQYKFKARTIVGQVYWPDLEDVELTWAQVCLRNTYYCFEILDKQRQDAWHPFVINLTQVCAERNEDSECVRTVDISNTIFQGIDFQTNGTASEAAPYTFYVDGVQFYP